MHRRIGIYGGAFNPIHNGHLMLAEHCLEQLNLDFVIFIPFNKSDHKSEKNLISGSLRLSMIKTAIKNNHKYIYSDIEIKRGGTSYTVDTIKEIRKISKKSDIFLLVSIEWIFKLKSWRKYEKIFKNVNIVVVNRIGYEQPSVEKIKNEFGTYSEKIIFIRMPLMEISSTEIRYRIKNNKSIRHMTPISVENLIYKKNLYK